MQLPLKLWILARWSAVLASTSVAVIVAVAWIWDLSPQRFVRVQFGTDLLLIHWDRGDGVFFHWRPEDVPGNALATANSVRLDLVFVRVAWRPLGPGSWAVTLPYWAAIAVSLSVPAWVQWRWWRRRCLAWRVSHDLCWKCGYDLRFSTVRCPECGEPRHGQKGDIPH